MALTPGTRIGSYEIVALIGKGGMGEVYRATDTNLARHVAIKVLPAAVAADADRLARFDREAKTLAALNHPNIAQIYGLERSADTTALVMELVEGPTLADRIAQGPVPVDEALAIAKQIAEALEAAHEQGIIHRDLKPANVKVKEGGTVKVLDFGLAKALGPDVASAAASSQTMSPTITTPAMTQAGMILGTAAYMSPEQAKGKPADRRSDVWAFGAVLFEMLTGRRAFEGSDVSDTLANVLKIDPSWGALPSDLSPTLVVFLKQCLHREAKQRLGDIRDMRLALDGAFDTETRHATAPAAVTPPGWRQSVPTALAALVVGGALVAGSAWAVWPVPEQAAVNRFDYDIPATQAFRNTGRSIMAFSRDGRRVVYNTTAGLYVRAMDELEARLIPGTEGNLTNPFFSPDGQSVGYFDLGTQQLMRIAVSGGAPVVVGPATNPLGATWELDGTILFAQPQGILRVAATGGTPDVVIPAANGEAMNSPQLLPDGDSLLFSVTTAVGGARWEEAAVVVQSLRTGERTVLVQGGSDARYVPAGHLIYALGDGLFAVAFDANRLAASPGPVPLVQGVFRGALGGGTARSANYAVSDQGTLVYVSGPDSLRRTLVWVDRDGREEPVGVPPRAYTIPRVSPDGTRIAALADGDLWVTELARPGTLSRVTTDPATEVFALWTPDGERLLFQSQRTGAPAIFSKAADGRGEAELVLTDGPEGAVLLSPEGWSADGELVFVYTLPETGFNFGRLPMDGSQAWESLLETGANEDTIAVSPDGQWIAYEADDSGRYEIYIERFPEMGGRLTVSIDGGRHPVWSTDGRELFYRRGEGVDGTMMVSAIQTEPTFAPGPGKELFRGDYYYPAGGPREYDLGPDGRFVMIKERVDGENLPQSQIIVVLNWHEELKRLVPVD